MGLGGTLPNHIPACRSEFLFVKMSIHPPTPVENLWAHVYHECAQMLLVCTHVGKNLYLFCLVVFFTIFITFHKDWSCICYFLNFLCILYIFKVGASKFPPKLNKYGKCLGYFACGLMICLFQLVNHGWSIYPFHGEQAPKNYISYFWTPCMKDIYRKFYQSMKTLLN